MERDNHTEATDHARRLLEVMEETLSRSFLIYRLIIGILPSIASQSLLEENYLDSSLFILASSFFSQ
jgi:hypothetical protein